ncbi:hypothetical protein CFC21_055471 [Triticum aestivum]|uniref:F-box domain-containing protein n=2 Tax=Triticum aestivum TaxID=4565 RepID=A0A3B6I2Z7_WHEAT|nr:hypothetical protein CFC21_055471 [Triticum aestivum]
MAPPATSMADIPDVMLEEIFLRLTAAEDLARASTTCPSFRRVIADHAFLRRYRALHPPPLIGLLQDTFSPAQPPHPSAVAARAFLGFDFSCSSLLPSTPGHTWRPVDFFDGRALLAGPADKEDRQFWVRDLAVCDPIHHRYVLLPAVPDDLKALAPQLDLLNLEAFLAPGQNEDPLSFRVMCVAQCTTKLLILVFYSSLGGQGQWHAHTFDQWSGQATSASDGSFIHSHAEGMLGMLTEGYGEDNDSDPFWLTYSILRNNQWHFNKVIQLPVNDAALVGVAGGYLLLEALYTTTAQEALKFGCFSVDVKTLQVEFFAELICSTICWFPTIIVCTNYLKRNTLQEVS